MESWLYRLERSLIPRVLDISEALIVLTPLLSLISPGIPTAAAIGIVCISVLAGKAILGPAGSETVRPHCITQYSPFTYLGLTNLTQGMLPIFHMSYLSKMFLTGFYLNHTSWSGLGWMIYTELLLETVEAEIPFKVLQSLNTIPNTSGNTSTFYLIGAWILYRKYSYCH